MGERAFNQIQYGLESSAAHGTQVAATRRSLGTIAIPTDRKPTFPEDTLALRARSARAVVYQILADSVPWTLEHGLFQELPAIFSCGLKGAVTSTEQTVGKADYLWDFTPALDTTNAPDSLSLEIGDDVEQYLLEYCMAKRITISGKLGADEPVKVEAELFARQVTPGAFTASQVAHTPEAMIANLTKIYVDPTWAALGSTQKTNILREFSIEILTGLHPRWHGETKTFSDHGEGSIDVMGTFTFEGNSEADTLFDAFQAGTPKAIRLMTEGGVIGTSLIKHSLTLDLYGIFEEIIPMGSEQDGDNLHTAVFHCISDGQATPHMLGVKVSTSNQTI